jgi:hypothetical protein
LVPRHPPCALTILTVIWPNMALPPHAEQVGHGGPGDTRYRARLEKRRARISRRLSMAADVASVQFSRTVERHERRPAPRTDGRVVEMTRPRGDRRAPVSQSSTACWGRLRPPPRPAPQVVTGERSGGHPARSGRHARPDLLDIACLEGGDRADPSRDESSIGAPLGAP